MSFGRKPLGSLLSFWLTRHRRRREGYAIAECTTVPVLSLQDSSTSRDAEMLHPQQQSRSLLCCCSRQPVSSNSKPAAHPACHRHTACSHTRCVCGLLVSTRHSLGSSSAKTCISPLLSLLHPCRRLRSAATDAASSSSSLIPDTLQLMESDTEFQATLAAVKSKGQAQLTREEARARKRSLQHLNLPSFADKLQVCLCRYLDCHHNTKPGGPRSCLRLHAGLSAPVKAHTQHHQPQQHVGVHAVAVS
jgi:hypothetical protein